MKILIAAFLFLMSLSAFSQDSTNTFDYNYKKGTLHYNKGVSILNKADVTMLAPMSMNAIPDSARTELMLALPFFQKAYSLDSKNEKVLKGLQGVYFIIDNNEYERYKKELEALKK